MKEKREIPEVIDKCSECGSSHLERDLTRAETFCRDCGLVQDIAPIDRRPDRVYKPEMEHTGRYMRPVEHTGPYMRPGRKLKTVIGWDNNQIPDKNKIQIYRLRKLQKEINSVTERKERSLNIALSKLDKALSKLDKMTSSMKLPRVVRETTVEIYQRAYSQMFRGRSVEQIIAAALYAACRKHNVPLTLDEIAANLQGVSRKQIRRTFKALGKKLKLKESSLPAEAYVSRFCSKLNFSDQDEIQKKAIEIIEEANEKDLDRETRPSAKAGSAIYISSILCGEQMSQSKIADAAGVTRWTISNGYKELANKISVLSICLPGL